jgi:hypothetical protein
MTNTHPEKIMPRKKKPPKKTFALVNLCTRKIGKRHGRVILHEAPQPPHVEDYPAIFHRVRAGHSSRSRSSWTAGTSGRPNMCSSTLR